MLVCAKCKSPWRGNGSPSKCPDCESISYPVVVASTGTDQVILNLYLATVWGIED